MTDKNISIRITKSEFELINKIIDKKVTWFDSKQINDNEFILSFENNDKALELDELIKNKLIYQGLDVDYNPTQIGQLCENLIDKLFKILK